MNRVWLKEVSSFKYLEATLSSSMMNFCIRIATAVVAMTRLQRVCTKPLLQHSCGISWVWFGHVILQGTVKEYLLGWSMMWWQEEELVYEHKK